MIKYNNNRCPMGNRKHSHSQIQYLEPPIDYSDDSEDNEKYDECNYLKYENSRNSNHCNDLNQVHTVKQLQTINYDRLTFDELIGQGGFGKVFLGKYNGNSVAIKEPIYYDRNSFDRINQSIIEEAKIHSKLHHPNIIKTHGISMFQSTNITKIYLVMEYARGKSLRDLLTKKTLSPNIIIKFAIQISSAMEYLHNFKPHAIIHRDLKSPNILLNEPISQGDWRTKKLKLTDLGLAREFTHSTRMSQCGTYSWMAPESITHSKFSKASDVWGFGVVLWELLTGQIPYRDFAGPAIAFGIGNRKLTLPIPTTCPEELKKILQACWNQEAKLRPNFTDIRNQLENSSFNVINLEQFQKMKQNWFDEIENIWQSLREKEEELRTREERAKRKEAQVKIMKKNLEQQKKELKQRELDVVGRELNVLLLNQDTTTKHNKKRVSRKKLPVLGNKIGYPQNFCHNLTITNSREDNSVPILQARALNQTWGPGTKIRTELVANLFNSSRSSSLSQDLGNKESEKHNDKTMTGDQRSKMKKFKSFVSNMFRSKTSLDVEDQSDNNIMDGKQDCYQIEQCKSHRQFARNRTYHGQTKYSERQRIDEYESFQHPYYIDDSDDQTEEEQYENNNVDPEPDYELKSNCKQSDKHTVNGSFENDYNYNDVNLYDYNNNCNRTNSKTHISSTTSNEGFDDDLMLEFDKFELEFQSMNGT